MDVCKCIVPSRYGGTLNSRRTASPLVRLVEGKWGKRATANDMRHLALCHHEFSGPRSGLCRPSGISNNNNKGIIFRRLGGLVALSLAFTKVAGLTPA
ncbi:uncharacterized protein TNCV_2171661 [Trichonephila clavipes]|nr:uncharacterized protein TNCV_2171661 [Trichonephila clavipes]